METFIDFSPNQNAQIQPFTVLHSVARFVLCPIIERNLVFCGFPINDEPKVINNGYAVKLRYNDAVIDDRAILAAIGNRGFIGPYDFS